MSKNSMRRIKNKKYKKYNRNVKRNISPDVELEYCNGTYLHMNSVCAAVNNYEKFLQKIRKINDKELTDHAKFFLTHTLEHINTKLKQHLI